MKKTITILLCTGTALLFSSCITAALGAATAATGVAAGAVGSASAANAFRFSSILKRDGAPGSMEGLTVSFAGSQGSAKLTFPKGGETDMIYTRVTDKTATLICNDGPAKNVYHMTFTSGDAGTYAVDCTAEDGTMTSGHGTFSLK